MHTPTDSANRQTGNIQAASTDWGDWWEQPGEIRTNREFESITWLLGKYHEFPYSFKATEESKISYIKSAIRSAAYEAQLISKGVEFAPQEDVATCMMKLATDRTINGKRPRTKISYFNC